MSFSVRCDRTGLEYNGTSLNGLFAQRRNLLRPTFYRMVRDILQFNRQAPAWLDLCAEEVTVGQFLAEHGYSREFAECYLLPMGSAIWSCPHEAFAKILRRFVYHHPVYTTQRASAQRRHGDLLCANRTSFCGAYWGNGFHED